MKMTADELRAHALRTGAEVSIDGKVFNSARAQIEPKAITAAPTPRAPVVPVPVAPPAVESFTRAEVERLLAEQDARFTAQLQLIASMVSKPEPEPDADDGKEYGMCAVGFTPKYNDDGLITFVGVQYERLQ